ncbi:MAG: hypothetical protein K6A65_02610 [Succinivibrionaceae bacterium]|nr:hypothetical protein [Succinivibrionaceae bacterium]
MADSLIIGSQGTAIQNLRHDAQVAPNPEALRSDQGKENGLSSTESVPSFDHATVDHSTDVFSHNRYQALSAYLSNNNAAFGARAPEGSVEARYEEQTEMRTVFSEVGEGEEEMKGTALPDAPAKGTEVSGKPARGGEVEDEEKEEDADPNAPKAPDGEPLDEQQVQELEELKKRDEEVRVHENRHKAVGGELASSPQYEYTQGPDGERYITGGHVNIDMSEGKTPEETIEKMEKVKAAAEAPADPSTQDRKVAAEAMRTANEARAELAKEQGGDEGGEGEQEQEQEPAVEAQPATKTLAQRDRESTAEDLTTGASSSSGTSKLS